MSSYIISILTIATIGGITSALISSKSEGVKKHISFIIGLISAIVLMTPIIKIVNHASVIKNELTSLVDTITDSKNISKSNSLIIATTLDKLNDNIVKSIVNKYGFDKNDVTVSFDLNTENIELVEITKINVTLKNKASWSDTEPIRQYIEDLVGVQTVVKRG